MIRSRLSRSHSRPSAATTPSTTAAMRGAAGAGSAATTTTALPPRPCGGGGDSSHWHTRARLHSHGPPRRTSIDHLSASPTASTAASVHDRRMGEDPYPNRPISLVLAPLTGSFPAMEVVVESDQMSRSSSRSHSWSTSSGPLAPGSITIPLRTFASSAASSDLYTRTSGRERERKRRGSSDQTQDPNQKSPPKHDRHHPHCRMYSSPSHPPHPYR